MRKIEGLKEKFLPLYEKGKNDSEIGRELEVCNVTIKNLRESLNLPKTFKYTRKFNTVEFLKLHQEGLNDTEISIKLGISSSAAQDFRKNVLKKDSNYNTYEETEFTDSEFQVFLGTMLGDGHLQLPNDCKTVSGEFVHCLAQKEFCLWKYRQLKRFCREPFETFQDDKRTLKRYFKIVCKLYSNPLFNKYYDLLYSNKIKYIKEELFNKIESLGLATWYMDDGTKSCTGGCTLCTNSFTKEDLDIIIKVLKNKFNISANIYKDSTLYIPKKSYLIFESLIKPHIIPSMQYKMGPQKIPLNGEQPEVANPVLNLLVIEENV